MTDAPAAEGGLIRVIVRPGKQAPPSGTERRKVRARAHRQPIVQDETQIGPYSGAVDVVQMACRASRGQIAQVDDLHAVEVGQVRPRFPEARISMKLRRKGKGAVAGRGVDGDVRRDRCDPRQDPLEDLAPADALNLAVILALAVPTFALAYGIGRLVAGLFGLMHRRVYRIIPPRRTDVLGPIAVVVILLVVTRGGILSSWRQSSR